MADRLISADKLKAHYAWWEGGTLEKSLDEMKKDFDTIVDLQPTVEAEPKGSFYDGYAYCLMDFGKDIVLCRDCKHHEDEEPGMVYCPKIVGGWVSNYFYCGDAERVDEVTRNE